MGKVLLPAPLAEQVRLLLRDPVRGRTRHGALHDLWIELASQWVAAHTLPQEHAQ